LSTARNRRVIGPDNVRGPRLMADDEMNGGHPRVLPRVATRSRCMVVLLVAVCLSLATTGSASAAGFRTGFLDAVYLSQDSAKRAKWLDRTVDAGSKIVRIHVFWAVYAGPTEPLDPRNPASYNLGAVDAAVTDAAARNLDVLLTITGAPSWAEGDARPPGTLPGTWKPDARAFGDFAHAVAARYSGQFAGLPRVRYFQAWNEPNLSVHLAPQYHGKKPRSPLIYRRMLNAFYEGVHAAQPNATVVTAGTAPYGDRPGGSRMPPLIFWRRVLCLKTSLQARHCPTPAHLDVLAHHPIDTVGGPRGSAFGPNNVSTADFHLIRRTLRAAERRHTLRPAGHRPAWATEIWWESKPPDRAEGVPMKKHARWLRTAVRSLHKQGARVVLNYLIRDRRTTHANRFGTTASGIFLHNGKRKPAFKAWRRVSR
jgi:Cellulase (glycosyl hydrolase family 5)